MGSKSSVRSSVSAAAPAPPAAAGAEKKAEDSAVASRATVFLPSDQEKIEVAVSNALLPFETSVEATLQRIENNILMAAAMPSPAERRAGARRYRSMVTAEGRMDVSSTEVGSLDGAAEAGVRSAPAGGFQSEEHRSKRRSRKRDTTASGADWSGTSLLALAGRCAEKEELLFMASQATNSVWRHTLLGLADLAGWYYSLKEPARKGTLAQTVQSKRFELVVSMVILINAVVVFHTTNEQMDNFSERHDGPFSMATDIFFLLFYSTEIVLKLAVHKLYFFHGPEKGWNVFDFTLVIGALVEQVIFVVAGTSAGDASALRAVRILKMTRVLRVVRVMRIFSDLRLLMRSIVGSLTSLFWAFMLLGFCFYLNGLMLVQGMAGYLADHSDSISESTKDGIRENFGTVQQTMLSFFKAGTNGQEWNTYYVLVTETGIVNSMLFIVFMGFLHISLLNILTATFVEQVMRQALPDKQAMALLEQRRIRAEAEQFKVLVHEMDEDRSGTISKTEFRKYMEDARFRNCLSILGLDVRDAHSFFELLLEQGGNEVAIDSLIEGAMRMRGNATGIDQHTLIMDVRDIRKKENGRFALTKSKLEAIEQRLISLEADTV